LKVTHSPYSVALVTPLMARIIENAGSDPVPIFIDSTASCDQTNSSVTTLLIPSKAGALPITICLHSNQNELNYTKVFELAKSQCLEINPNLNISAFMSDNAAALKNAFRNVWPNVAQLLCLFHLLAAFWAWIFVMKNGVKAEKRQILMKLFKAVVYSTSEEEMEANKIAFLDSCGTNAKLEKYFLQVWESRKEWCLYYRLGLITRSQNTNNYSEATVRVLKDIILCRQKAHNSLSLLSFFVKDIDAYYSARLTNHAYGRANDKNPIKFLQTVDRAQLLIDHFSDQFEKVDTDLFKVPSSNGEGFYQVNSSIGYCNCVSGAQGGYCKHQAAVAAVFKINFTNCPSLTSQDKANLFFLANGSRLELAFFEPLDRAHEPAQNENVTLDDELDLSDKENNASDLLSSESESEIDVSDDDEPPNKKGKFDPSQMLENFDKACLQMRNLFEQNASDEFLLKSMKSFTTNASKLQTGMQLAAFCNSTTSARPRVGRKIAVQPTSVVRRTTTNSKNRRVMRAGRPIGGVKKPVKRPRNLALNIEHNRLNAKSHGDAH
jgi:MULE transposase domain